MVASGEMSPEIPVQVRGVSVCGFVCHKCVFMYVMYMYIHM